MYMLMHEAMPTQHVLTNIMYMCTTLNRPKPVYRKATRARTYCCICRSSHRACSSGCSRDQMNRAWNRAKILLHPFQFPSLLTRAHANYGLHF